MKKWIGHIKDIRMVGLYFRITNNKQIRIL